MEAKLDCGDSSCEFAESRTGMRTNGGCRCLKDLPVGRSLAVRRYITALRQRVQELEEESIGISADNVYRREAMEHLKRAKAAEAALTAFQKSYALEKEDLMALREENARLKASLAEEDTAVTRLIEKLPELMRG